MILRIMGKVDFLGGKWWKNGRDLGLKCEEIWMRDLVFEKVFKEKIWCCEDWIGEVWDEELYGKFWYMDISIGKRLDFLVLSFSYAS